jgi:CrcB protein
VSRQALTETVMRVAGPGFPWGTIAVNLLGSTVMGGVAGAIARGVPALSTLTARHFVMTGLLGGFTTFSSFSGQTLGLLQEGRWFAALANVLISVTCCVAGCAVGYGLTLNLTR